MTSQATQGACAFAWRHYLLRHNGISENDDRRSALYRYVSDLRESCEDDFDLLQIAAVAYLKKLDELHDERGARLAVDQVLAERLEARRHKSAASNTEEGPNRTTDEANRPSAQQQQRL